VKKAYLQKLSLKLLAEGDRNNVVQLAVQNGGRRLACSGDNKFKKTCKSEVAKQAHFSVLTGSEGELLTAPESFLVRKGLEVWVKGWNEHGNLGNSLFKDLACFERWPFQWKNT